MTKKEFNKKRDELLNKCGDIKLSLKERMLAACEFTDFMKTKSHNGYWNPKYKRYLKLSNGILIRFQ